MGCVRQHQLKRLVKGEVEMLYLENKQAGSSKFYRISIEDTGDELYYTWGQWGAIGSGGSVKPYCVGGSKAKARRVFAELRQKKTRKRKPEQRYTEVEHITQAAPATPRPLVRQVVEEPASPVPTRAARKRKTAKPKATVGASIKRRVQEAGW